VGDTQPPTFTSVGTPKKIGDFSKCSKILKTSQVTKKPSNSPNISLVSSYSGVVDKSGFERRFLRDTLCRGLYPAGQGALPDTRQ
jgi:hypothetical protein